MLFIVLFLSAFLTFPQDATGNTCHYSQSYQDRYTVKCNFWKLFRCTQYRTKYRDAYRCCSGWGGSSCSTPLCFERLSGFCRNGGTCQSSGYCRCQLEHYGTQCENNCPSLSNCDQLRCTSSSDRTCDRCNGDYGAALGQAYTKSSNSRGCIKQCSWRSNSNACYPGTCSDGSCRCTSGFTGADCRTMLSSQSPTISHHEVQISSTHTSVDSSTTTTVYTNTEDIASVRVYWIGSYQPTGLPVYSSVPYIHDIDLGIIRATSMLRFKGSAIELVCPDSGSQLIPKTGVVNCDVTKTSLPNWNIVSGDTMYFELTMQNGGNMQLYNRDASSNLMTRYYTGRSTSESVQFTFDYDNPTHCIVTEACRTSMLDVGPDTTFNDETSVTWYGWSDSISGIKSYHLEVREMSSHGSEQSEKYDVGPIFDESALSSSTTVVLPEIGLYSFVLSVEDIAGNQELSRRFVLFENKTSGISVSDNNPMIVISAAENTKYQWITEGVGAHTSINLVWEGHFENTQHHRKGYLNSIADHTSGSVDTDYDQTFGKIRRSGQANKLGIVQFCSHFDIDNRGGETISTPSISDTDMWVNEGIVTSRNFDINVMDGNSIRFWIEARDISDHFKRDSILVNVDSTPPVIEEAWSKISGRNVFIHNTNNLRDIRIHFKAYDVHSGLKTFHYQIKDRVNSTVIIERALPVRWIDTNDCQPSACVCSPNGDCYATDFEIIPDFHISRHNFDYTIYVFVTNNALLSANETVQMTIDVSPPVAGCVHDGIPGDNDIDYQDALNVNIFWDGFFDPESGIGFYEYIVSTHCHRQYSPQNMTRTTMTQATWIAKSPGTYYATVVAYNNALELSELVCTDGVTIDPTPPTVSHVNVQNTMIREGLIIDGDDNTWFVNNLLEYTLVLDAPRKCRSYAIHSDTLTWFNPPASYRNMSLSETECARIQSAGERMFLAADKQIDVSWNGEDNESGIYDYFIGLSSGASDLLPDIMPFKSTSGRNNYKLQHPNIIHGSVFFVVVKAVNKAQMVSTKIVGPLIVDVTPPRFEGNILLDITKDDFDICWFNGTFYDDVDLRLIFKVAIGLQPQHHDILPFTEISDFETRNENRTCVRVSSDVVYGTLHPNHVYYASVKATNAVGLSVVAEAVPRKHVIQTITPGNVYDLKPSIEERTSNFEIFNLSDTDVQSSNSTLRARWYGFYHPHKRLEYFFGVGANPGEIDVSGGYLFVGSAQEFELGQLILEPFKKYYVTIQAVCETGTATMTSDGVVVMAEGVEFPHYISLNDGICRKGFCDIDIDYQVSTSMVTSQWNLSESMMHLVTNVEWSLEKRNGNHDNKTTTWSIIQGYKNIGFTSHHIATIFALEDGGYYRSSIKLCFYGTCFKPLETDGFLVMSRDPLGNPGSVIVSDLQNDSEGIVLDVSFQQFDYGNTDGKDVLKDVMKYYEWTLSDCIEHCGVLLPWKPVNNLQTSEDSRHFTVTVDLSFKRSRCLYLLLRGWNQVGLSTTVVSNAFRCDSSPPLVIDNNHEVQLLKNGLWNEQDQDYMNIQGLVSAVWPTLRHGQYTWAVIESNGQGDLLNDLKYPCDHPSALACGKTEKEYINVKDLSFVHGNRYHVCIHANKTTMPYKTWTETLPEISVCSDGVIFDTIVPTPGEVEIGSFGNIVLQTSSSEVEITWDYFTEVESELSVHYTGVAFYEVAIGTAPGKHDIVSYQNVGFTNRTVLTRLDLRPGIPLYATVKGTDFVGLSSISSSDSFIIDDTAPDSDPKRIILTEGAFFRSTSTIVASWDGIFWDNESGISHYEWAIGSEAGYSDVKSFTATTNTYLPSENMDLEIKDGHPYFITLKAINTAGLTTSRSFGAFRVDTSSPTEGHVYDSSIINNATRNRDYDWVTDMTSICAVWEGFHDPHTSVTGYSWKIGLCKGCNDMLAEQYIGIDNDACSIHIEVVPGSTYFVTVSACNAAGLCTSVTSDGIAVDNIPPAVGKVHDGNYEEDIQFTAIRNIIYAKWWGFHDPESKMARYEWRAGTTPYASNIVAATQVHHSEFAMVTLNEPLSHNSTVYITVRAINKAGLWAERTSNGYVVDDTGPVLVQNISRNTLLGIQLNGYQVARDVVDISWEFNDNESGIQRQHVFLKTHHGGDVAVNSVEIGSSDTHYIFTNLSLHDGSRYTVHMVACNGADVCSMTQTEEFLVDSSVPSIGAFANNLEHVTESKQPNSNWMTWSYNAADDTSILQLAWFGFTDLHSGISHYFLTVGTDYDSTDLLQISPLKIEHSEYEETQIASVRLSQNINNIQRVYASVWAVNQAGLRSPRIHHAFDVALSGLTNEGSLVLHRHCEAHSCEGHCVCAPANQRCPSQLQSTCTDVSQDNPNEEISVIDILSTDIQIDHTFEDIDYTPSLTTLSAIWFKTVVHGLPIHRYEWSLGLDWSENGNPQGVYDPATQQIWHDIGPDTHVIITLDEDNKLTTGDTYLVFVRAWYNDRTYAIFKSDGVTPYPFPPKSSGLMGAHVKEIVAGDPSLHDIDFITDGSSLTISWSGVFIKDPDALDYFELAVGTSPGGQQLQRFVNNRFQKNITQFHFANINLEYGKQYYATIHAFNKAGVYSSVSSDGVIVDTQLPNTGVVYDGKGLYDKNYQTAVSTVSAFWYGFYDLESYIEHYVWCVGNTTLSSECSMLHQTNVGMHLTAERNLKIPLLKGQRYYSKVFVVDAAGHKSETIISNGFIVDTTPPVPISKSISGDNLLYDPSFEEKDVSEIHPSNWTFIPTNSCRILHVGRIGSVDGASIAVIYNEIRQSIRTIPGSHYILTYYTSHVSDNRNIYLHQEGMVEAPGLREVFRIYNRPNHGGFDNTWQKNVFYFTAEQTMSTISISSHGDHGLYLDLVSVKKIQFYDNPNYSNAVDVHLQSLHGGSSLHASWQFIDDESPIVDYQWAIGTVLGGTQLQEFTSVGDRSYAMNIDLILTHVPQIFVTVVAKNKAGLIGIAYSDGITVDFTPPDILYVREETEFQEDVDFTSDGIFNISWGVRDIETGISFCEWSIGYKPNSDEIESHSRVLNAAKTTFEYHLQINRTVERKVFVSFLCQNNAGLSTYTSSNGITMVTNPPDASHAYVNIIATSETEYPLKYGYQSNTTFIKAIWRGFEDPFGVQLYQCKVSGPSIYNSDWQDCGTSSATSLVFTGLTLNPGSIYRIDVRAVNYANLVSHSVGSNVTVYSATPKLTGKPVILNWSENSTLTVSWSDTFADVNLWYEISIGSILGGSDVMQWVETTKTHILISDLNKLKDYHLTLTAINNVGLSNTINYELNV